jgi:CHAD domain-containing protein
MANVRLPATRRWRAHGFPAAAEPGSAPVPRAAIDYLDRQHAELLAQEPRVRSGEPDAIHQMRSATRRLRSVLDIYGSFFDSGPRRKLGGELKWLAKVLGRARDAEVVRERLQARLRELPEEWRTVAVTGSLEHALDAAYDAGRTRVLQALDSKRYRRLLEDLARFHNHPPATSRVLRPAGAPAAGLVNNQARIVDRAHRAILRTDPGRSRDLALHRLRKDTKRLLYAAESVAPTNPKRVRGLISSAHRLQRILGSHQDSVMACEFLEHLMADPSLPEDARLACERIRELEEGLAASAARQYSRARRKLPALRLRR